MNMPGYRDKPGVNFNKENRNMAKEIFCRFIRKNGKIIYPKNGKFFHFWIEESKDSAEAES